MMAKKKKVAKKEAEVVKIKEEPEEAPKRRGREPTGNAKVRVLAFVSPETHQRMQEDGRPYSTLLRLAIEEFLDKAEAEAK